MEFTLSPRVVMREALKRPGLAWEIGIASMSHAVNGICSIERPDEPQCGGHSRSGVGVVQL